MSGASEPRISAAECRRVYEVMVRVEEMDKLVLLAPRQGRLSVSLSRTGEEGVEDALRSEMSASILVDARPLPVQPLQRFLRHQLQHILFEHGDEPKRGYGREWERERPWASAR